MGPAGHRTPAQALLLAALDGRPTEGDWRAALALAPQALLPYLADRLDRSPVSRVLPPDLHHRLVAARRASAMAALQRRGTLATILSALERAGIEVVVLKGAALAHLVYPDPALRPMQDIDLWIGADDLYPASDALCGAGYRFPDRTMAGRVLPTAPAHATELSLELPGTRMLVELHSHVASLAPLGAERTALMWSRAAPAPLGSAPGRVLHHEDLLLHLGMHGARHDGFSGGLLPLLDVALTVRRWEDRWDWAAMADDYRRHGAGAWMYLALTLARDLLAAPVPPAFFEALPAPAGLAELETLALEQAWSPDAGLPPALEQLAGDATWPGRARWLLDRARLYVEPGEAPGDAPPRGGWWRRTREALGRLGHDLRTKVPRYLALPRRAAPGRPGLGRRLALARRRSRLARLVAEAEAGRSVPTIARGGAGG